MFVKWYEIETLKGMIRVQGLGEKFVAESLNDSNIEWSRPKAIKTPLEIILQIFHTKNLEYILKSKVCGQR